MYRPTPEQKQATKLAAKKRADRRQRRRDLGRHIFAYAIIGILVIGTFASVIAPSALAPTAPLATVPVPTQPGNDETLRQLITQGDQALLAGDTIGALSYYRGYLSLNPNDDQVRSKIEGALTAIKTQSDQAISAQQWVSATTLLRAYINERSTDAAAHLSLAKAILNGPEPDYVSVAASLQQASNIPDAPSEVKSEALSLLQQHQPAIQTAVASSSITGTVGITGTLPPGATSVVTSTASVAPSGSVTATIPISPTGVITP